MKLTTISLASGHISTSLGIFVLELGTWSPRLLAVASRVASATDCTTWIDSTMTMLILILHHPYCMAL